MKHCSDIMRQDNLNIDTLSTIWFDNREYPVREVLFDGAYCLLSTISLERALLPDGCTYVSDEARRIDEGIIFFVDDEDMALSDEQLVAILTGHIN